MWHQDVAQTNFEDEFKGRKLNDKWQWSVFAPATYKLKRSLQLNALPSASGAYVGTKTTSGDYVATAEIKTRKTTATAGLGLIGDDKNTIAVYYRNRNISVVQLRDGKDTLLLKKEISTRGEIGLQMKVTDGKSITFLYSTNDKDFTVLNEKPIDGSYLPPWDRAVRVGLISKGPTNTNAVFDEFELINH